MVNTSKSHPDKRCFVICPIGSVGSEERRHSDNLFHDIIERALESQGFSEIVRADKVETPGSINDQIINYILNADLIIADLSFHNPNAFYELGIADHAGKPTVLFCRKGDNIPFDKSHDRVISAELGDYHDRCKARKTIVNFVDAILKPSFRVSNPVTHAKAYQAIEASADPKDKIIADLERRVLFMENRKEHDIPEILDIQSEIKEINEKIGLMGCRTYHWDEIEYALLKKGHRPEETMMLLGDITSYSGSKHFEVQYYASYILRNIENKYRDFIKYSKLS